jgi:steroid 5-alpha reductase family enzyme
MSLLLMRVSGLSMMERHMRKRPGYDHYVRSTSAFFPRPPRDRSAPTARTGPAP